MKYETLRLRASAGEASTERTQGQPAFYECKKGEADLISSVR